MKLWLRICPVILMVTLCGNSIVTRVASQDSFERPDDDLVIYEYGAFKFMQGQNTERLISYIFPAPTTKPAICADLESRYLVQAGDTADGLFDHFSSDSNVLILLDNHRLRFSNDEARIVRDEFFEGTIQDASWQQPGTYNPMTLCVNLPPNVMSGDHRLKIGLTTTSGAIQTIFWLMPT
jgi:hypothetical protein